MAKTTTKRRWLRTVSLVPTAVGVLSFWKGSSPETLVASQWIHAPPARASAIIVAPETLPRFFRGVDEVEADPGWPVLGSTMTWSVAGFAGFAMTFRATVVENTLPACLVLHVRTPSPDSVITQRFTDDGHGGTLYEKQVELHYRGWFNRLVGPLLTIFLRQELPDEVGRAAAVLADARRRRPDAAS
jgi:hypothetical protein